MAKLPTGTLTFLFSDVEGSTSLWERFPEKMQPTLARHDSLVRQAIERNDGVVVRTLGDSFFAAFPRPIDAVHAVLEAQRSLRGEKWPEEVTIRVRMALHTGAGEMRDGDYYGPALNRAARLLASGHGGQTLLSAATHELVRDDLPSQVELRDLGRHRLKDLIRPEHIYQLTTPDLPSRFPPLKTLDARLTNLPEQITPFVGRERELTAVCELLARPEVRLVTLIGPGGTGKTRLAMQAAAESLDHFENGALFVPLAPITEPELVATTIAGALGVRGDGEEPPLEQVKQHIGARELLLLLDNYEQIMEAAPLVSDLLHACPNLTVLVTSREILRVAGEHVFPVSTLEVPDLKRLPNLHILSQYDAVALFIQRAQAARADFMVTNENAPAVAEICVRLDGLPLAIELAAARIRVLPPESMLPRLQSRLKLLTGGGRDLPSRQQTLRGAIDWSFTLLDTAEQELFARLAVFHGSFSLVAVEEVCGPDLEIDPLDGMESLVDKSLVHQGNWSGEPGFSLLETIREYAAERLLAGGHTTELQERHAAHYLSMAEEISPQVLTGAQREALDRIERDHDNLRAVTRWALEREDVETATRLVIALSEFWRLRGHFREARDVVLRTVALDHTVAPGLRARALTLAGMLLTPGQEYERAAHYLDEALALRREIGDEAGIAGALNTLAHLSGRRGDTETQRRLYEESLALYRQAGNASGTAILLGNLGNLVLIEDDAARAVDLFSQALTLHQGIGNPDQIAGSLWDLSRADFQQGNFAAATAHTRQALEIWASIDHNEGVFVLLEQLAAIAVKVVQLERGVRLYGAAEGVRTRAHLESDDEDMAAREQFIAEALRALGRARFEGLWEEGYAVSTEEAIAMGMGNT